MLSSVCSRFAANGEPKGQEMGPTESESEVSVFCDASMRRTFESERCAISGWTLETSYFYLHDRREVASATVLHASPIWPNLEH
jgi:hypothetical protein